MSREQRNAELPPSGGDRRGEVAEYPLADETVRDAIGEDDNEVPLWFNLGFYGMLVVGLVYLVYYTTSGWSQVGQYDAEVARFEEVHAAARAALAKTNPFRGDAQAIEAGAQVFATICAACHKPDGTGLVGPSLVDPYSKYGADDEAMFESVAAGRPGGMPPWGAQLGNDKIWQALAYLETLPKQSENGVGAPAATP